MRARLLPLLGLSALVGMSSNPTAARAQWFLPLIEGAEARAAAGALARGLAEGEAEAAEAQALRRPFIYRPQIRNYRFAPSFTFSSPQAQPSYNYGQPAPVVRQCVDNVQMLPVPGGFVKRTYWHYC